MSGTTRRLGTLLAFAPCSLVALMLASMAHLQVRFLSRPAHDPRYVVAES